MILWLYLGVWERGKIELYVDKEILDFRVHLYRNRLY